MHVYEEIKVMTKLKSIRVAGWKSIKDSEKIELGALNVFIGANGAGKSNLVSFFKLLNEMISGRLQEFLATSGGAESVLHYGAKVTPALKANLELETETGTAGYYMTLVHAAVDTLIFRGEGVDVFTGPLPEPGGGVDTLIFKGEAVDSREDPGWLDELGGMFRSGHRETLIVRAAKEDNETAKVVRQLLDSCRVYHFHDTSSSSHIRQPSYVNNDRFLMPDGGNLAAMLYRFRESESTVYSRIVTTVRQIAPFFGDFELEPMPRNPNNILLNWREKGIDQIFGPHQLSDGTLRAMALTALLLQPETNLPALIVIDEPELGLHPYAIGVLASLVMKATHHCQVILATQSPAILDAFDPEVVVVVDRKEKGSKFESEFRPLPTAHLDQWLEDYTLSEAWEKNVFGGGPH